MSRSCLRYLGFASVALLVFFSLQPLRLRAIAGGKPFHLLLHVIVFGLAALFPLLLSVNRIQEWTRTFFMLCLGAGLEISQSLLYKHPTEWRDFKADVLGILAALVLVRSGRMIGMLRRTLTPTRRGATTAPLKAASQKHNTGAIHSHGSLRRNDWH